MSVSDKFYIQSINRALLIVDIIAKSGDAGLSLTALAEKSGLPVSTVYRILENLISWQYILEDEFGFYKLGFELITLGSIAGNNINLKNIAHPHIAKLGELTRETVYLAVLDEDNACAIYIDKIESKGNIKLAAGIGSRNRIHSTANGKILVSGLKNERIRELLSTAGMPALTESTITDTDTFLDEIDKVRTQGYAIDDIENEPGVRCVAAPILDDKNRIVGSVSLSGISSSVTLELIHLKYKFLIMETAQTISKNLGRKD